MDDQEEWCTVCDEVRGKPNVSIWGTVTSHKETPLAAVYGRRVCVSYFICDDCRSQQSKVETHE